MDFQHVTPDISRYPASIHEAGHAVVARALGLVCGEASIAEDETGASGYHIIDVAGSLALWASRGLCRDCLSAMTADIISTMAGSEAELLILGLGFSPTGDGRDRRNIAEMIRLSFDVFGHRFNEARLRRMAMLLCRRHRRTIETVAAALRVHVTMSGAALNDLVGAETRTMGSSNAEPFDLTRG